MKLRFQNCKEKMPVKASMIFLPITLRKWWSANGPHIAEGFLRRRKLAGLEMEPLALKDKRVDLWGIGCVTDSWSNDTPASHRGRWNVLLQRALLLQYSPYFSSSFSFLLSNAQEMGEVRSAFYIK